MNDSAISIVNQHLAKSYWVARFMPHSQICRGLDIAATKLEASLSPTSERYEEAICFGVHSTELINTVRAAPWFA